MLNAKLANERALRHLDDAIKAVSKSDPYRAAILSSLRDYFEFRAQSRLREATELDVAGRKTLAEMETLPSAAPGDKAKEFTTRLSKNTAQLAADYSAKFNIWLAGIADQFTSRDFDECVLANPWLLHMEPAATARTLGRIEKFQSSRWRFDSRDLNLIRASTSASIVTGSPPMGPASIETIEDQLGSLMVFDRPGHGMARQADDTWVPLANKDSEERFNRYCAGFVAQHSTPEMHLFSVLKAADGYKVPIASKIISLTKDEFRSVSSGVALSFSHPLSQIFAGSENTSFVMYSDPMMMRSNLETEADSLCFGLQYAYPEVTFFRDPFSENTSGRSKSVMSFQPTPGSVVAVVADSSFKRIDDGSVIANLKQHLAENGVPVLSVSKTSIPKWGGASGKGVIVITGHSSDELREFIQNLGEAGYFRDNYVLFNSCETVANKAILRDITGKYGAIGVAGAQGVITASQVEEFLADLASQINARTNHPFDKMLRDATRKFKLNFLWLICRSDSIGGLANG